MKSRFALMALMPLLLAGCAPTRIVTVSPDVHGPHTYSTTVTVPKKHTVTTTQVYAANYDISLHLDLQAVAAAFAQSSTIKEFEMLLNSGSYMISNLDLNRDGYVDYLRVVSAREGYTHLFVIQACLGMNIFQDVATVVAEVPSFGGYHVQVIGSPYIYGANYIVEPVFVTVPHIFVHLTRPGYSLWMSPYHWNHFPSYYKRPRPVYLNHYQAYVHTYMTNHYYCHHVTYPKSYHYAAYDRVSTPLKRNDYGKQHPEQSFSVRNANTPTSNSAVQRAENASRQPVVNSRDIRQSQEASKVTTTTSTSRGTSAATSSTGRGSSTSGSTTRTEANTTVRSSVRSSGSSETTTRTTAADGTQTTTRRGTTSAASSATATTSRSAASTTSSRSAASNGTSSASSSRSTSSTSSSSRSGSTGSARRN